MNADGNNQTRLTNSPKDDWAPAWSADGTMIVFPSNRDGDDEIYLTHADGTGNPTNLTNNGFSDLEPAW